MIASDVPLSTLVDEVGRSANADGGWPYYVGRRSRLESTAWALLAQCGSGADGHAGVRFVTQCQRPDGLFIDPHSPSANFASHALALLAMAGCDADPDAVCVRSAVTAAVREKGIKIPYERQYYQNNHLQGWSWCPDAFSWVEPTAWSVLALKKVVAWNEGLCPMCTGRIAEGERLLFNRACPSGGWNYGNANMYGRELHAHVPTTAVALLALQDRRDAPAVSRGLSFLRAHALAEHTALTLALVAVCLELFDEDASAVRDTLTEAFGSSAARGHVHAMAMVLYALAGSPDRYGALRL